MTDALSERRREAASADPGVIRNELRDEWVRRLLAAGEVVGPVRAHGGDVQFAPVRRAEDVLWDFSNSLDPPKRLLLPQTDPLVRIGRGADGIRLEALREPRPRLLLNVRPCDARALEYLRRVQAGPPADEAYLRQAAALTVVVLACDTPCESGFCVCCDAGPFLSSGYDLQISRLGDVLLAEPGTSRGARLIADSPDLFTPAAAAHTTRREALEQRALRSFGDQTAHLGAAMRRISTGRVAEGLWERMAEECFECGACTLVCPTCHCFSVKDRPTGAGWERCRLWDSCQYAAFTLEASGHNPRSQRKDRLKRRFFHKVSAQYFAREGMAGCVGCGRCVQVCLGSTGLPRVVAAVRRGSWDA